MAFVLGSKVKSIRWQVFRGSVMQLPIGRSVLDWIKTGLKTSGDETKACSVNWVLE